ncbi:MAG: type II CRISPR RNA-guided endonuclease Cas9 [Sediminibacterium sp.]|uniref:type II CRISPR RNA-guided endonuclease Cas9 n=1 Tax=Sediminibacterium sp. TaxID=1917865 RepID=UPI00272262B6|nr:type II CRISPR RNA-guided endonuclease Cas9 [Sediminibacterium sp.]MDO8997797.1 type II CRISPR RNA-guided endonuclease Cas9 [Sediminibacterium sp.]
MKKILGIDLGTTSIGWAFVHEAENENELSTIRRLGVRVNPLSSDEQSDFEKGKSITLNSQRTLKRGARRNLARYKLRRENLIEILLKNNIIYKHTILTEVDKQSTYSTYELRAKSAVEKIEKVEFARVLLMINKKRGYKSSRKAKNEEEGQIIDGMAVAKKIYDENISPGELCYKILKSGKTHLPDFYRSDLKAELEKIWEFQRQYYPEILTEELKKAIEGQGKENTRKRILAISKIYTAENKGADKKIKAYEWRSEALKKKISAEELAFVITEINNNINSSSGYLGEISDRSKELYFNKETIGQYLFKKIKNPNFSVKGQVFYRQDYLDEFETIWETQSKHHPELNTELKKDIRDVIVFYQRKLKSQKGLINVCEFESKKINILIDGIKKEKIIGNKVAPKSSPLFQEFKIWQILNNIEATNRKTKEKRVLDLYSKEILFSELNFRGNLKKEEVLRILGHSIKEWDLNYSIVEGNHTNKSFYETFEKMILIEGAENIDFSKQSIPEINETIKAFFNSFKIDTSILNFNSQLEGKGFEKQSSYQLWHLIYSYEDDNSNSGKENLYNQLLRKFGFKREFAQILSNVSLLQDYGNLSSKAIRRIIPHIKELKYSEACKLVGYNHSSSITKEENDKRQLKDKLEILPKNSLRNPIVEKILNQMINVVNAIIADPNLGKPDEIRIELARELKKNAKERAELTSSINEAKINHERIIKELQINDGIKNPTRNDIIRYKLYQELKGNGYKTLYSDTYIPREKLFSKEFDIEHIIPKSRIFDDSFSNKTLAPRQENINKKDETALDFVTNNLGEEYLKDYLARLEMMYNLKEGSISKSKYKKLLLKGSEIGEGFIERDLRDSQYIAKKAKEILFSISKNVITTTGSITDKLREDWDLINVMQELNFSKYKKLGLTEIIEKKDGNTKERIIDWTKRNDHRHHAMDALTIAFTKRSFIQYLNNLNARSDKSSSIYGIEQKETTKLANGKRLFKPPLPNFREEAKKQLENILVSFKAKNKVVTKNKNKIKAKIGINTKIELTPRGQLHKDTVYGKIKKYTTRLEKIGPNFDESLISKVAISSERNALLNRLKEYNNDPKLAFSGKNSLKKNPIYLDTEKTILINEKVKIVDFSDEYTIRKEVTPDLNIEKIIDKRVKQILLERLQVFEKDPKKAFSNLEKNPIWLNEKDGIKIKRVKISGISNAVSLHYKRDHLGNEILDSNGIKIPVDYVSTGNNHHVAIFIDKDGNLQENVISFFEAVERVNQNLPIIDKNYQQDLGWQFLFTMKQNEYFVFPSEDFDPNEIDLLNPINYKLISKNLFRVQKIATKNYMFRHHLETDVEEKKQLVNIAYINIRSCSPLKNIIKVRINHIGQIIKTGE